MKDILETPVLFLIFNRPDTTRQVFEAIAKAKPRRLYVAADGPRINKNGEVEMCQETRDIINQVDWECDIKTLFREQNLGCKMAVQSAISWFFEHEEAGIILEDDCLPSRSFFSFCSEMLKRYAEDERIMMVSGCNFQNGVHRGDGSYYFSRTFHIWGWATWRRAWSLYDPEISLISDFREKNLLNDIFTDQNIALSWMHSFALARNKHVDSWDYPWAYSCFVQNGVSIAPNRNLVTNIGFGVGATHTTDASAEVASQPRCELDDLIHPQSVYCNEQADLYESRNVYPCKDKMGLWYRYKRMRKARRLRKKIERAYRLAGG